MPLSNSWAVTAECAARLMPGPPRTNGQWSTAILLTLVMLLGHGAPRAGAQEGDPTIPSGPGVVQWHYRGGGGLKLTLTQLAPDNLRAFLSARGFAKEDREWVATRHCAFGSAMGSAHEAAASPPVTILLADWRARTADGKRLAPILREAWEATWKRRRAPDDARVAFYWALFPTRQTFGPSDYHWGMVIFPLAPGSTIDLEVHWREGDEARQALIRGLECGK